MNSHVKSPDGRTPCPHNVSKIFSGKFEVFPDTLRARDTRRIMTEQIIEKLSDEDSWAILQGNQIGRIASAREGAPDIYPVSFIVVDWVIYFRTGLDSRLRLDTEHRLVAFETAVQAPGSFSSAVALGVIEAVTDSELIAKLDQVPIIEFAPNKNYVWLALRPQDIRGRRLNVIATRSIPTL